MLAPASATKLVPLCVPPLEAATKPASKTSPPCVSCTVPVVSAATAMSKTSLPVFVMPPAKLTDDGAPAMLLMPKNVPCAPLVSSTVGPSANRCAPSSMSSQPEPATVNVPPTDIVRPSSCSEPPSVLWIVALPPISIIGSALPEMTPRDQSSVLAVMAPCPARVPPETIRASSAVVPFALTRPPGAIVRLPSVIVNAPETLRLPPVTLRFLWATSSDVMPWSPLASVTPEPGPALIVTASAAAGSALPLQLMAVVHWPSPESLSQKMLAPPPAPWYSVRSLAL